MILRYWPEFYISVFLAISLVSALLHLVLKHTGRIYLVREGYSIIIFVFGLVFVLVGIGFGSYLIMAEGLVFMMISAIEHHMVSREDRIVQQVSDIISREHALKKQEAKLKKQIDHVYQMAQVVRDRASK